MSAVLERKPEIFESVHYFDTRRVTNAAKRWAYFALDVIQPERKAELSWLAVGGEETSCPCLQRYGRGFVPRGRAALLEMGGEPIPMQHMGELQATAWDGGIANEKQRMGYVPVYPGDGMKLLKRYSVNDGRKGLDELETLQGLEWEECHTPNEDGILDVIELAQFGDGMAKTLKGLEEQIKFAKVNDSRIDYGKLQDEELKLCEASRHWAMRKVGIEHGLLKLGHIPERTSNDGIVLGGWSYGYSPVTAMLIEQLEVKRQDQPIQEMADMVSQIIAKTSPAGGGMSAADMDLWERRMDEKLSQVKAQADADLQRAIAEKTAELEAKYATKEVEVFVCETCGQETGSLAGLKAHQRARHATEG